VTYGCEIMLTDTHSGISTAPLIIRKVDKGRVSADDGGPVSQMQKIALQRVNHDGSRHYLSAAGPIPGTPGVVASPTSGMPPPAGTHPLLFSSPRVRDELKDGVRVISDEVDDYLCWTIVGICTFPASIIRNTASMSNEYFQAKFQYTFFDAFGQNNSIPETPITPFPTLFTAPIYRPTNNTVELTVTNFFYEDPNNPQRQQALDIYLGNLGPLRYRVYSTSPPGPLTTISPFLPAMSQLPLDNGAGPSTEAAGGLPQPMPNHRYNTLHTMVIVEMPPLPDVIKALEEDALPPNEEPSGSPQNETSGPNSPDDGQNGSGAQPPSIAGRTLPLLFIRSSDGIGYHSGRTIACENVFHSIDLASIGANPSNPAGGSIDTGWLAAAQATAAADGGLHGWTLRVM
jgi:recombining binding protein (suppressor of hairless)